VPVCTRCRAAALQCMCNQHSVAYTDIAIIESYNLQCMYDVYSAFNEGWMHLSLLCAMIYGRFVLWLRDVGNKPLAVFALWSALSA
jgi:hypothetical protein